MYQEIVGETSVAEDADPPFFVVSSTKFMVMSVFTFGLYSLFWFFMQWKVVRAHENSRVWPAARGLLLPMLFCHALFVRMRDYGAQLGYKPVVPIWLVTLAFILANIYGVFLKDIPLVIFGLDFFLVPMILLPMQLLADKINMRVAPAYPYNRHFSKTNIVGIILGTIAFGLIGLGYQNVRDIEAHKPIRVRDSTAANAHIVTAI